MYHLKPIQDAQALNLLRWRNQTHVRESMISKKLIEESAHLKWWNRVSDDATKRIFILEKNSVAVAVINYFDIEIVDDSSSGWWGFYLTDAVSADSKNMIEIWTMAEVIAIAYAFDYMKIDRLLCETRDTNASVLLLHDRMGFVTLEPNDYPNAMAHNLIVKCLTREMADSMRDKWSSDLSKIEITPDKRDMDKAGSDKITLLSSANWEGLAYDISKGISRYTKRQTQVFVPPFGQYKLDLLDETSDLRKGEHDAIVFAERMEDFLNPLDTLSPNALGNIDERFLEYLNLIELTRRTMSGQIFVNSITLTRPRALSNDHKQDGTDPVTSKLREMNSELLALTEKLADTFIVPVTQLIDRLGNIACEPGKYWLMGRFPFGPAFGEAYAEMLAGTLMHLSGATARCLVLDLDNTLWGGVIGDDGMNGIQLDNDYPGNQFKAAQNFFLSLIQQGLILCICSKNTESIAIEVIEKHPNMIIRKVDLAAWRINWDPKSVNIIALADELDLGLRSLMFIDDNPMERNEVRQNCPSVIVPEMPLDVSAWPAFLAKHPALMATTLLAEDGQKAQKYKIRNQIASAQAQSNSKEDFLRKLDMGIEIKPVEEIDRKRALQLIAKTNQFNTTSIRYSESEINQIEGKGGKLLTIRITDKYGSDEVIGVVVLRKGNSAITIDNFIMSCRVLGRGVEAAVLAIVSEWTIAAGMDTLKASIIETERNYPCRTVFADNGFDETIPFLYEKKLDQGPLERPDWFDYL